MKGNLSDRRKLNLRLESVLPQGEKSPSSDLTPTFNNSIRHFDSDLESEHGKPVRVETTKAFPTKVIMFCVKCDRLAEDMKALQYSLEESERNSRYLKSELEHVMDLHKSSRLYATEQKNLRLEQELKQILIDKTKLNDENRGLKEKLTKQEKELRYSQISRQNSIKSVQSYTRTPLIKLGFQHVGSVSVIPREGLGKFSVHLGKPRILDIEEDDDSLHTSQNLDDIGCTEQQFQDVMTPKSHAVQEKFSYLNSNFRRLSNEFSNMLVMLESVIQVVLFGNTSQKPDEKAETRKTANSLLVDLNNKLKKIQLIFREIQETKDTLNDFPVSPKYKEEETDERLANRYVFSKKRTEKKFNLDINTLDCPNKETEAESDRIYYSEIIEAKNEFIHQMNKGLVCVWDDCKDLKEKKKLLKIEITKELNLFKNQIIQNLNTVIFEITKTSSKSLEDQSNFEKEIMKNREKYNSIINKKDQEISKLKLSVKQLKENEKRLSDSLFSLSRESQFLDQKNSEKASFETEVSLKLKQKKKSYKERVMKYKRKYNSLKDEYNNLYLESKELLKKYEENEASLLKLSHGQTANTQSIVCSEKDLARLHRKNEKLESEIKIVQKDLDLALKLSAIQKIKIITYEEKVKELTKIRLEFEKFLSTGSSKKSGSESVEYLEKLLSEERKKNRSLTISLNLMKGNFNDIEKNFKENIEKISELIENNSKLNIMIESLKEENSDLKEEFEHICYQKKEDFDRFNKELEKIKSESTSEFIRGNLKNKLEALEKDLENSRKKFNLMENFKALDGKGANLVVNSEKLLENYKLLNQENVKLKEFLKLIY